MSQVTISTINEPEFINLQPLDINPLMSKCEIKVMYIGENRNKTFISKEAATEMAKTLRGAPIVGYYREDQEDFSTHGQRVSIEDGKIKFEALTKPYGFVAPDAKVWFQTFTDEDDFGNDVEHEYLMTTGFLWTGQFEEAQLPINEGRPQSMELEENSMQGHWAKNSKTGLEFFIINDAIFSKLCILGKDVEPCFEGADVTAPSVRTSFTLNNDFSKTLYSMMQELNFALKGGQNMNLDEIKVSEGQNSNQVDMNNNFSKTSDTFDKTIFSENKDPVNEGIDKNIDTNDANFTKNENTVDTTTTISAVDGIATAYSLLQQQFNELQTKFNNLETSYNNLNTSYQELVSYKNNIESQKKDELINSFYMLSDVDKQDVITNKDKYSLDEIESKLSVIYTKQQFAAAASHGTPMNQFSLQGSENQANILTYTLDQAVSSEPDWVQAVMETQKTLH